MITLYLIGAAVNAGILWWALREDWRYVFEDAPLVISVGFLVAVLVLWPAFWVFLGVMYFMDGEE